MSDSSVEHDPGICGLDPAHLSHLNNSAKVPLNFDCELIPVCTWSSVCLWSQIVAHRIKPSLQL